MSEYTKGYVQGLNDVLVTLENWIDISTSPEYIQILGLFHHTIVEKLEAIRPVDESVTETKLTPQLLLELEG